MTLFDLHTHIISPDTERYPSRPLGGNRSTWSSERPVTLEQLLRSLDEAGIEKAAVVQAATMYGFDNSYVADSLADHRDRLIGVGSIDLVADDALERIDHWIGERGFAGVRVRAADGTTAVNNAASLDDPRLEPAWSRLEADRIPVCIQMHSEHAPVLASVLRRHPGLVVALDHGARPNLAGGPPYSVLSELFELTGFPNVFLKITPITIRRAAAEPDGDPAKLIARLVEGFGSERIAWGSNFPASAGSLAELRAFVEGALAELAPEQRVDILGGTAARIYPQLAG
ncbi:amidohydrolase family protein [Nocardia jiangxiensis]|uniref:Amidohydrolase family protein n=1 Tax=Nocardia jiangxiensis TaxID=282685 RepID=A0ABW6RTB0_9NOCA|nr:amidohydrolase family protein [Nocardia jiangxiensis]